MTEELREEFVERSSESTLGNGWGLKGKNVVVVSDSRDEVYRELKEKKMDGVYVFYSPNEEEKQYGFLFG